MLTSSPPPPATTTYTPSISTPATDHTDASASLQAYLAAPLPYAIEDWVKAACPSHGCTAEKRFYCAKCVCWVGVPAGVQVPRLCLPLEVNIIIADNRKKSTAIQVGVLATESVRVWDTWTGGLEELAAEPWEVDETLVLFPSQDAVTLNDMSLEELAVIKRVVVLDSRWNNTTTVLDHPGVRRLTKRVKLKNPPQESLCWRYHSEGEGLLSSAEALYYFFKDYEWLTHRRVKAVHSVTESSGQNEDGEVMLEEIMHIFRLNINVIKESYNKGARKNLPLPMEAAGKARIKAHRSKQRLEAVAKKSKREILQKEGGGHHGGKEAIEFT
jgi:hypothetical protein